MASESELEVWSVNCDSCGFTEDCTPAYIALVRDRYDGKWICGLCAEAVEDTVVRSPKKISTKEALNQHIGICKEFRDSSYGENENDPITEIGRIFRKSLEVTSPRTDTKKKAGRSGAAENILATTGFTMMTS